MFTKTLIAAALVLAPAFSTTAFATNEATQTTSSAVVRTDDLNLTTVSGKATLNSRIASAVNRVCGAAGGTTDLQELQSINKCRAKARHDAFAAAQAGEHQALAAR